MGAVLEFDADGTFNNILGLMNNGKLVRYWVGSVAARNGLRVTADNKIELEP